MEKLFSVLGIDIKILIAQLVNFALLLAILYKVGYKPILNFIHDRTEKIEKGIQHAEEAEKRLAHARKESEQVLIDARKEAQSILYAAREQSEKQAESILKKHEQELELLKQKAQSEIEAQRDTVMRETKEQAVQLVIAATEKVLREKVDEQKNHQLIEKILKEYTRV